MVCERCITMVETVLQRLGHQEINVSLGAVSFSGDGENHKQTLEKNLGELGFSLAEDEKLKIRDQVKSLVEIVYSGEFNFPENFRFATIISEKLGKGYKQISEFFISIENETIEQYIINYRINKVKELLVYTQLTLTDIAFKLNYSSVAHLSAQFKQVTGLTPTYFRGIKEKKSEPM